MICKIAYEKIVLSSQQHSNWMYIVLSKDIVTEKISSIEKR